MVFRSRLNHDSAVNKRIDLTDSKLEQSDLVSRADVQHSGGIVK